MWKTYHTIGNAINHWVSIAAIFLPWLKCFKCTEINTHSTLPVPIDVFFFHAFFTYSKENCIRFLATKTNFMLTVNTNNDSDKDTSDFKKLNPFSMKGNKQTWSNHEGEYLFFEKKKKGKDIHIKKQRLNSY